MESNRKIKTVSSSLLNSLKSTPELIIESKISTLLTNLLNRLDLMKPNHRKEFLLYK
jgi:BMFP domain-containing protein YqiC